MERDFFDLVGEFWPIAWSQLWQVTVLMLVVALATRLFAKNRAHLAHLLWLVVLIKCLTPPICASPGGVFSRMEAWFSEEPAVEAAAPHELIVSIGSPSETEAVPRHLQGAVPPEAAGFDWTQYVEYILWALILTWPVGVVLTATVFTWRWTAAVRRIHRSSRAADCELQQLFESLQRRLKIRLRVRLLVTESAFGPAVVGTFRPTVVLPESLLGDKSTAELEPIMAHELLHIRRGDTWTGLLQTVLVSLWWFHPLVLWVSRRLSREAERCCDEAVIAELSVKPADYARCLLDVLEGKQTLSPIPAFPAMRPVEAVSRRMESIMRRKQGWKSRTPRVYWIVMALLLAVVLPGAAWSGGKETPDRSSPAQMAVRAQPAGPDVLKQTPAKRAPGTPADEIYAEIYIVEDLIKAIRIREDVGEEVAKARLLTAIVDSLDRKVFVGEGVDPSTGYVKGVFDEKRSSKLNLNKNGLKWLNNNLVVNQSQAVHEHLRQLFAFLREPTEASAMGAEDTEQLQIQVRFISMPSSHKPLLADGWLLSDAIVPESESVQSVKPGPWFKPVGPSELEPIASGMRARTVVERRLPAVFQLLDDAAAKSLLDRAREDKRTNLLQSPKVTVYNGQSAFVSDTSQSPFVVGVREVKGQFASAMTPQIQVVPEGTTVQMRPLLQENGNVRLECRLILSKIEEVNTKTFMGTTPDSGTTIQMPTVAKHQVDTAVEMPLGKTLVIGGMETKDRKGNSQSMRILIRPEKVD